MILGSKGRMFHACMKQYDFRIVRACSAEQSVVSTLYDTKKHEKVARQGGFRMA